MKALGFLSKHFLGLHTYLTSFWSVRAVAATDSTATAATEPLRVAEAAQLAVVEFAANSIASS